MFNKDTGEMSMFKHDITDVYDILTVGTETIPPKEIYYEKLGKLIYTMRNESNVTPQQIQRATGITPDMLLDYEMGRREIPIYDLLVLMSYLENHEF